MKVPAKVIVVLAVIAVLSIAALIAQRTSSSGPRSANLSAADMELLIPEILGPEAQAQISRPEQKKELAKDLKQFLAIAQIAEREGFANRPEVQAQIDLLTDDVLARAYTKKHPEHKITDDEINAYVDANGSQIEAYLAADPKAKQIEGAQLDSFKRAFAQSKIGSQLARKEGLDEDKTNELMTMFTRSRVLYGAYMNSLIEKYHEDHKNEYEQVRARHILISTSPQDEAPPTGAGQDKEGADKQPKALSKEEARKKAESILARVRKGEDFAKLASEFNPDATKETGGDLDYFSRGRMLPEFEQAAFALKPGEVSDLVETQYGFHIIKVEDRRLAPVDDPMTQQQILAKLQPELDKLAESSNIKVAEDFNFTPKAAPPRRGMPGGVPNPHGGPPPQ